MVRGSRQYIFTCPHLRILIIQYAQPVTRGLKKTEGETEAADVKQSSHVKRILEERKKDAKVDPLLEQQFKAGRLLAAITSRPGQSGRADGHILEGKELDVSDLCMEGWIIVLTFSSTSGSSRSRRPSTPLRLDRLLYHEWIHYDADRFRDTPGTELGRTWDLDMWRDYSIVMVVLSAAFL